MKKGYYTTPHVRRRVKTRDGNACVRCGSRRGLTVHHAWPVADGGPKMEEWNMITLCRDCHRAEHRS